VWLSRDLAGLCRPEGHSLVEIVNVFGHQLGRPWGAAWWRRDCEGLCRPEVCGPVEIVNACGSPAGLALGMLSSRAEIVWACADLRSMGLVEQRSCRTVDRQPGRPRDMVQQRWCRPEGWESEGDLVGLWSTALVELRSGPQDQRSHGLWSSRSSSLWGRAGHAALAVLSVNHGMEKPSTN
jgi:hypothetical protein